MPTTPRPSATPNTRTTRKLRALASAALLAGGALLLWGHAQEGAATAQVQRGAETYRLACSDCHGSAGGGITEGRRNFEPEHQTCERCHRPQNAPTAQGAQLSERNAFSIGEPPPLASGALGHFGTAAALHSYLRAAMPRYAPGTLPEESYWDVTAFLLELSEKLPPGLTLTPDNAGAVRLR